MIYLHQAWKRHELHHLQWDQQRTTGARTATIAETRFETEVTARAAQTPAGLTSQEYAEVYTGRMLYAQTAYSVEEILARLSKVAIARFEWNRLRGSAQQGVAGLRAGFRAAQRSQ